MQQGFASIIYKGRNLGVALKKQLQGSCMTLCNTLDLPSNIWMAQWRTS
jgi:hypothetical protein